MFQLYCEKERLDDQFEQLKAYVDIGDILGARGTIKRTEKGITQEFVFSVNYFMHCKCMLYLQPKSLWFILDLHLIFVLPPCKKLKYGLALDQ